VEHIQHYFPGISAQLKRMTECQKIFHFLNDSIQRQKHKQETGLPEPDCTVCLSMPLNNQPE
jgi:hypothetical protein